MTGIDRSAVRSGFKEILPLAVPPIPVGIVLGLAINDADAVPNVAGWFSSIFLFAGASQFAAISLLSKSASALAIIATVGVINARHIVYSAALTGRLANTPRWFRIFGPYLLVDQMFGVVSAQPETMAPDERVGRYLGGAVTLYVVWNVAVTIGLLAGTAIPTDWSLDFAVPLLFLSLCILSITNRPGVLAAAVGAVAAIVGQDFPRGSGVLFGILCGVIAGAAAEWWTDRDSPAESASALEPT